MESEKKVEVAKGWLEGGWGDLMGIEFEFGKMKVLEMEGGGDSCTQCECT